MNCFILLTLAIALCGHNKEEWRSRSIYQLMTDRFARTDGKTTTCTPQEYDYCGGTFIGIKNNLDYIQGMGFDAIWISPVIDNTPKGYHGYWARNIYMINKNWGTEQDLIDLVTECHKRDIWVMADVVANHVGPVKLDYSSIYPFNDATHYHDYCQIYDGDFNGGNQWKVENCRLADLPDLKQENPMVKKALLDWINDLVTKYQIDGLRIDTVPEVPVSFWPDFVKSAGVFCMGEVYSEVASYIKPYLNSLDAILNYPMFYQMRYALKGSNSFWALHEKITELYSNFGDSMKYWGMFADNHDNDRMLYQNDRIGSLENGLILSIFFDGIPIIYYGDEQAFNGGRDPMCREALWGHMDKTARIYKLLAAANAARKKVKSWTLPFKEVYQDDHCYAFTKGDKVLVLITNNNMQQSPRVCNLSMTGSICNVLKSGDCVTVSGGCAQISLAQDETKVYTQS